MMNCKLISTLLAATLLSMTAHAQKPVDYVNTCQGTDSDRTLSHGNTYPCTTMPQGTHGWSPRTRTYSDMEKYVWADKTITGFDLTHMCNMWMRDYCVLTFMPEVGGRPVYDINERATTFSHTKEVAKPHYYKVLMDNGIQTEIAPTDHCSHMRFTFPAKKGTSYLVLDGSIGNSEFNIDKGKKKVTGYVQNQFWGSEAAQNMKCWFVIYFDKPISNYEIADGKASLSFGNATKVNARIACSFISAEMAEIAYEREISQNKTFEVTKANAEKAWNERLGSITVKGGTDEHLRTFYSCMYRANCFPRKLYEFKKDGSPIYYSPYDGEIHDGYMYADIGLWDAYHSQMPLYCMISPEEHGKYVASFMDIYDQQGWLPAWSSPGESGMMTGNHAISILADAWAKGIRTFDPDKALAAYLHDATNKGPVMDAVGRPEWEDYFTYGFVPVQEERGCATSKTLEYCYDDFCAWKLAHDSGNTSAEQVFERQIENYKNVFDNETGFMRGRNRDGSWFEPFDPKAWDGYFAFESKAFCEGNAWQWTWAVNHDIQGLIDLFGGEAEFITKLDSVFTENDEQIHGNWAELKENQMMASSGLGQYIHGNETDHHLSYLYTYVGQPWKSQKLIRQILDNQYSSTPEGYPGDEDQGAMSAWYVMNAIGLYCVTPGTDQYVLGSPLFETATIKIGDKELRIEAENNNAENIYVQSVTLNGKLLDRNYITHSELTTGGTLHFVMGPEPEKISRTSAASKPYSYTRKATSARFKSFVCESKGPDYDPDTQYRNPILPGFYPDPSICRHGNDYYMVNSSFNYFPILPIWHSTDMIHWEQLGSIIEDDETMPLIPGFLEWGLFAPQISYNPHNNKFYVVCTQVGGAGNFFCTTDDPKSGVWSKPTLLPDVTGIDPSFYWEEDGTAVIVSATSPTIGGGTERYIGDGAIIMWDFDWRSGKTTSKGHIVAQSGVHPEEEPKSFEGPHIYKIDGKYFMMAAEGGTELNHSTVLFECDDLHGTFTPCSINPILTQRDLPADRKDPVSCTGHADLVQSTEGNWYAVFLGCQPYNGVEAFNTGRETFLLPVHWRDGQPVILEKGEAVPTVVDMTPDMKNLVSKNTITGFDGLSAGPLWDSNGLKPFALTVRGSIGGNAVFCPDGSMDLACSGLPLDALGRCSMVLERMAAQSFTAETTVEFKPSCGSEAGLIAWHDDDHYMKLSKRLDETGKPVIRLEERVTARQDYLYCMYFNRRPSWIDNTVDVPCENDGPVSFRLEAVDATTYVFSYAYEDNVWHQIGAPLDGSMLSTMNCGGFQGAMVGVFTY